MVRVCCLGLWLGLRIKDHWFGLLVWFCGWGFWFQFAHVLVWASDLGRKFLAWVSVLGVGFGFLVKFGSQVSGLGFWLGTRIKDFWFGFVVGVSGLSLITFLVWFSGLRPRFQVCVSALGFGLGISNLGLFKMPSVLCIVLGYGLAVFNKLSFNLMSFAENSHNARLPMIKWMIEKSVDNNIFYKNLEMYLKDYQKLKSFY